MLEEYVLHQNQLWNEKSRQLINLNMKMFHKCPNYLTSRRSEPIKYTQTIYCQHNKIDIAIFTVTSCNLLHILIPYTVYI
jgi:hypothetical protein